MSGEAVLYGGRAYRRIAALNETARCRRMSRCFAHNSAASAAQNSDPQR